MFLKQNQQMVLEEKVHNVLIQISTDLQINNLKIVHHHLKLVEKYYQQIHQMLQDLFLYFDLLHIQEVKVKLLKLQYLKK